MYWNSDDRLIQFNFNRQKSGQNRAFYGHRSSSVFLTNILKYRLGCQLVSRCSEGDWTCKNFCYCDKVVTMATNITLLNSIN